MEENEDLRGIFGDKFSGDTEPVPDSIWQKVDAELQKKKRRGFFWWWFGSFLVIGLVGVSWFGLNHFSYEKEVVIKNKVTNSNAQTEAELHSKSKRNNPETEVPSANSDENKTNKIAEAKTSDKGLSTDSLKSENSQSNENEALAKNAESKPENEAIAQQKSNPDQANIQNQKTKPIEKKSIQTEITNPAITALNKKAGKPKNATSQTIDNLNQPISKNEDQTIETSKIPSAIKNSNADKLNISQKNEGNIANSNQSNTKKGKESEAKPHEEGSEKTESDRKVASKSVIEANPAIDSSRLSSDFYSRLAPHDFLEIKMPNQFLVSSPKPPNLVLLSIPDSLFKIFASDTSLNPEKAKRFFTFVSGQLGLLYHQANMFGQTSAFPEDKPRILILNSGISPSTTLRFEISRLWAPIKSLQLGLSLSALGRHDKVELLFQHSSQTPVTYTFLPDGSGVQSFPQFLDKPVSYSRYAGFASLGLTLKWLPAFLPFGFEMHSECLTAGKEDAIYTRFFGQNSLGIIRSWGAWQTGIHFWRARKASTVLPIPISNQGFSQGFSFGLGYTFGK